MLRLLIGVAGVVLGGYAISEFLDKKESQKRNNYYDNLLQQQNNFQNSIIQRNRNAENEERAILFGEIKREQADLKKERKKLYEMRNPHAKGSEIHKKLSKNIRILTQQIEQKQIDADYVRF